MKLQFLNPKQITLAKYNPKARTSKTNIKQLRASIEQHGILYPLLVDKQNNLIDGHRRLTCSKLLKLNSVPCIITESKLTRDEAFENINSTQRKLTNSDMIYIYVNGGRVPPKAHVAIAQIEEMVGKKNLRNLGNANISYHILNQAMKVAKYCKKEDSQFVGKVIMWIFKRKQSYVVRRAMEDRVGFVSLKNAVSKNRSLKINWK